MLDFSRKLLIQFVTPCGIAHTETAVGRHFVHVRLRGLRKCQVYVLRFCCQQKTPVHGVPCTEWLWNHHGVQAAAHRSLKVNSRTVRRTNIRRQRHRRTLQGSMHCIFKHVIGGHQNEWDAQTKEKTGLQTFGLKHHKGTCETHGMRLPQCSLGHVMALGQRWSRKSSMHTFINPLTQTVHKRITTTSGGFDPLFSRVSSHMTICLVWGSFAFDLPKCEKPWVPKKRDKRNCWEATGSTPKSGFKFFQILGFENKVFKFKFVRGAGSLWGLNRVDLGVEQFRVLNILESQRNGGEKGTKKAKNS